MNANEIARLAAAINLLRPEWPTKSLQTLIAKELGTRPYLDAAVALTYVACDPDSQTPARVTGAGPWWKIGARGDAEPTRATRHDRFRDDGLAPCGGIHAPGSPCDPPRTAAQRRDDHLAELRRIVADADRSKIARRDVAADSEETSDHG